MLCDIGPRPTLNFPNATAADWRAARRRLIGFLVRHDLDRDRAEEVAQQHLCELLEKDYAGACPASPAVAVGWSVARAKRYGIGTMTRQGRRASRRRRIGLDEAQPAADPLTVRDVSGRPGPAAIAAAIESAAGPVIASPVAARRRDRIERWVRDSITGWGEGDEPGNAPTVADCGPGYAPPSRGCPGLHSTDPNPATRAAGYDEAAADAARVGLALTRRG